MTYKASELSPRTAREALTSMRKRLQQAYQKPTYKEAKAALLAIHHDLEERNLDAAASLEEGLEETLTLHRLGLFALLGGSLKTTNCLESINNMVEDRCRKVKCWKNTNQMHRWLAASLLDIEPRLRKIKGYKHLPLLRQKMRKELGIDSMNHAKTLTLTNMKCLMKTMNA